MAALAARFLLLLQHLLPKRLVTAIVYRIARIRLPPVKNFLIRAFVKLYDVDLNEVRKSVPDDFECFNDFFTRELDRKARPIDASASSIVSPADGVVSAAGRIDRNSVFQAKGHVYTLEQLLATDLDEARRYYDGSFATLYLAPQHYHRVHAPLAGEIVAARFVPGTLYSVNATTVSFLPRLFTRNERLVCHFRTSAGHWALVFVGALNVGSITTPWTGELRPRKGNVVEDIDPSLSDAGTDLEKGDLLGWFNAGSTIILLVPAAWRPGLEAGVALKMGEAIGRIVTKEA